MDPITGVAYCCYPHLITSPWKPIFFFTSPKRMHRKPITKSHIAKEEEEEHRAKKTKAKKWSSDPPVSRCWGPRVSRFGLGSVQHRFLNPLLSAKLSILRFACLTIRLGLSPTSFLESLVIGKASNLEVLMSHNPAWAQSDVVSRIPCHRWSFRSQRELCEFWFSSLTQWEERALGKRKKKWRRRNDREERVRERRYLMGQVISHSFLFLVSISLTQIFLSFEWWKHNVKIKPNKNICVGPMCFDNSVMSFTWYNPK